MKKNSRMRKNACVTRRHQASRAFVPCSAMLPLFRSSRRLTTLHSTSSESQKIYVIQISVSAIKGPLHIEIGKLVSSEKYLISHQDV
jgi:hypothetical protein